MSSDHRPEIDGLRAVAIAPVVLFHAGLPGFEGGYVGVDVFFVISGFLITGILLRAMEAERFSLLDFYERRVRRIFPALFAVLGASSICAAWLLFPEELTNFGKSLFSTSLFYANYHFMHDTGYFAAPAESKPLLHMWSLAVEEQYYVLFPLYLYVAMRWCRGQMFGLTIVILMASLAYSIWLMTKAPDQAFYSAPARAWELMVGSVLAMLLRRKPQVGVRGAGIVASSGLLLIVLPVVFYSEATPFPGAMAIPPVLGTALVLYATAVEGNAVAGVLRVAPMRYLGLVSYSLYLWHWPVFVLYKVYAIEPLTSVQRTAMLLGTLLLAVLSWRFIEQPFRKRAHDRRAVVKKVLAAGFATLCIGVGVGALLALGSGFPERFSPEINRVLAVREDEPLAVDCQPFDPGRQGDLNLCRIGDYESVEPSFLVWGDSHGEALLPAMSAAARQAGMSGLAYVRGGCAALLGVRQVLSGYDDCHETAEKLMGFLADHPELRRVVLASRWALYAMGHRFGSEPGHTVFIIDADGQRPSLATNQDVFERGVSRTLERLAGMGREVAVVTQVPEAEYRIPLAMARAEHLARNVELAPRYLDYQARQAYVNDLWESQLPRYGGALIRPEQLLCEGEHCEIEQNALPIYRDSNHLTRTGALLLSPIFSQFFLTPSGLKPAHHDLPGPLQ